MQARPGTIYQCTSPAERVKKLLCSRPAKVRKSVNESLQDKIVRLVGSLTPQKKSQEKLSTHIKGSKQSTEQKEQDTLSQIYLRVKSRFKHYENEKQQWIEEKIELQNKIKSLEDLVKQLQSQLEQQVLEQSFG
ncbi:hypothetical protein pb186bvf_000928 [Paramecium bursaria]